MIPSKRLLIALAFGFFLGLLIVVSRFFDIIPAALLNPMQSGSWGYLLVLLLVSSWDAFQKRNYRQLILDRTVPQTLALGHWTEININIRHTFNRSIIFHIFDHYPVTAEMEGLPVKLKLDPGKTANITYSFKPLNRGEHTFGATQILQSSPLGLWYFSSRQGDSQIVRVYPDISRIKGYMQMAMRHQTSLLGIRLQQRRGDGMEFHQLREFQQGDSPRRIDWKASSRRQKLIAREYQDERDQRVIFLLDSGRNMRSQDDELSHFDHALNALLLLSYVALHEGDSVGLLSFGGEKDRWLNPVKSIGSVKLITETLYDLQPSTKAPDYLKAVEYLKAKHPKRSLIILISNLRDEATSDLSKALSLLVKQHLVLLANMREPVLDKALETPIHSFKQAMDYYGAFDYLKQRQKGQRKITQMGIATLDTTPAELPVVLINRYYALKRSSRL